ncbi:GNAT family N-acetyltransferase, partial [Actinospica durhamensis]|uniref:GNAT family N-acetyltransferase n=1 Tax=Actinospica durhamensis TaxID=1508375 RepID=UPI001BA704F1
LPTTGPEPAPQAPVTDHVLDDAVRASLAGAHARFAQRRGGAVRYHPDVAAFTALDDPDDFSAWADLAALLGPEEDLALPGVTRWPENWRPLFSAEGVQMVGTDLDPRHDDEAVVLGAADVPEILELIARTEPGPFRVRTVELGTYLGIRRDGALVAMAGERLRPPGWTEISAVCTAPEYRGQGLAGRLVRAVAAGIVERGDRPFLHTIASNENAIRLYRALGFEIRRTTTFTVLTRAAHD